MKHFILIFQVISFFSGISALTLLAVAYIKYRNKLIKHYMFLIFAMGVLLLEQTVSTYELANNLHSIILSNFIKVLSYSSCSYLIYVLPLLIHKVMYIDGWRHRKKLYISLASIPLISLVGLYIWKWDIFVTIANITLFSVIITALVFTLKNFKRIAHNKIKNYLRVVFLFFIVSLPYMYLDTKTEYISYLSRHFPYGLLSIPIFYLVWNGISVYWVMKYVKDEELIVDPKKGSEDLAIDFYKEYKITNREQEVIQLLVKGYSYQKISEQLYISLSTVKTHIRHIYQKTDVKNKIELIHMINGENPVI